MVKTYTQDEVGALLEQYKVDAKAIRAEALEEAANVCDLVYDKYPQPRIAATCAAAIRGLKLRGLK